MLLKVNYQHQVVHRFADHGDIQLEEIAHVCLEMDFRTASLCLAEKEMGDMAICVEWSKSETLKEMLVQTSVEIV